MLFLFFFFKQKTAYEMRISDWSSDVCSSDLGWPRNGRLTRMKRHRAAPGFLRCGQEKAPRKGLDGSGFVHEIVFALTWKEHVLPRVAAGVATVEDDHFVVVNVAVHQVGAGDMAHV